MEPAILGTILTVTLVCPRCRRRLHNEAGGVAFWPPRAYRAMGVLPVVYCAWCETEFTLPEWPGQAAIEDDPR